MNQAGVIRYDRNDWPQKAEITPEGFLRVDAPITRLGVLQYRNPDGSMRGELRHPDDWTTPAALESLRALPVTDGHPPPRPSDGQQLVDAQNAKRLAIGWTGENVRAEGNLLRSPMLIADADGVASIQRGRRGTSTGVVVDLKPEQGVYEGAAYDYRQLNPRGNHIAVVDSPRAGTMIRLDSDGNQLPEGERQMDTKTLAKVVLDGISYDAAPEVVNALSKAQGEAKELKTRLDAAEQKAKDDADGLRAERDTLKERLDAADKRDIRKEIQARVALETSARKVIGETEATKLDSMSDAEIKRAVVAKKWPALKLDDKTESYIATRYEIALEEQGRADADDREHADAIAHQRLTTTPRNDGGTDLDDAVKRANDRIANQFKAKAA